MIFLQEPPSHRRVDIDPSILDTIGDDGARSAAVEVGSEAGLANTPDCGQIPIVLRLARDKRLPF